MITADWLRRRGEKSLKTALVSKALQDNQQKKLGNASLCLLRNVGQGFCEKTADGFYITPEGLESLGHNGDDNANASQVDDTGEAESAMEATASAKPKRKKKKNPPPGASCRDRIKILKSENFFKQSKTPTDIVSGLGKKGWTHNAPQVGAALTIMFNKDEIQRTKDGGNFKYYWDRD